MAFLFIKVPHETARLFSDIEVPGEKQPIDEMHITLCYLGKGVSTVDVAKAMVVAHTISSHQAPFSVSVKEISSFPANPDDGVPIICPIQSPELLQFRAKLAAAFDQYGIEYSKKYEYRPHMTLAYVTDPKQQSMTYNAPMSQVTWPVQEISLWGGDKGEGVVAISLPFKLDPLAKMAARLV